MRRAARVSVVRSDDPSSMAAGVVDADLRHRLGRRVAEHGPPLVPSRAMRLTCRPQRMTSNFERSSTAEPAGDDAKPWSTAEHANNRPQPGPQRNTLKDHAQPGPQHVGPDNGPQPDHSGTRGASFPPFDLSAA